jgi:hypothetical protein
MITLFGLIPNNRPFLNDQIVQHTDFQIYNDLALALAMKDQEKILT